MEWIIGIFVIAVIVGMFKPSRCDICRTPFKRNYHTWTIEGKKQHLCPNCNSKMNRRQSNIHFKNRFG